jgi:hypothetical protein
MSDALIRHIQQLSEEPAVLIALHIVLLRLPDGRPSHWLPPTQHVHLRGTCARSARTLRRAGRTRRFRFELVLLLAGMSGREERRYVRTLAGVGAQWQDSPVHFPEARLFARGQAGGFEGAVETNGTQPAPSSLDWICVSPKAGAPLVQLTGDELKLVYPQPEAPPEQFAKLEFDHFFLQPMDGPERERNTHLAVEYCLSHPQWRLSLQTQKLLGLR